MSSLSSYLASPTIIAPETNLGTLTWAGGGDPGGTTSKTYRWCQAGKLITFLAKVTCANAGTLNTSLTFALPAAVPAPSTWSTQESSGVVVVGAGSIVGAITSTPVGTACLISDGAGGWNITITATAVAAKAAECSLSWITA